MHQVLFTGLLLCILKMVFSNMVITWGSFIISHPDVIVFTIFNECDGHAEPTTHRNESTPVFLYIMEPIALVGAHALSLLDFFCTIHYLNFAINALQHFIVKHQSLHSFFLIEI